MIAVYQIQLTDDQIDTINRTNNHDSVPAQSARLKMMFGAKEFDHSDFQYYTKTMEVDTDDLEEAFHITNIWNEDKIVRIGEMQSSTSVGDIFEKDGRYYVVDTFSFSEVFLFADEVA